MHEAEYSMQTANLTFMESIEKVEECSSTNIVDENRDNSTRSPASEKSILIQHFLMRTEAH
jgi:hypothetical protein